MLTPETEHKLTELQEQQHNYTPNAEVAAALGQKTLIMLVGPSCVGKTSIMETVVEQDDRFGITGTLTTRDKRPDDNKKHYTYIPHTEEGIAQVYDNVQQGLVVQYAVHPTTGRIYGSDLSHYPKDFDMLDTLATAVDAIERLPAKKSVVIGVVVHPENWRTWFDARFGRDHPDRAKRLAEASGSLQWLLGRSENSVQWVVNAVDGLDNAAHQVIAISTGSGEDNPAGPATAEAMLTTIREMAA